MKFWRRLRRPINGLVATSALLITGLAWPQAEQGDDSPEIAAPAVGPASGAGAAAAIDIDPAADTGANAASDQSAVALLDAFVAEVHDLAAKFEQGRFDEAGEAVEEPSTGSFALLRGDCSCLRLHYDAPDELIIVADGEWIWKYDVLFEQVDQLPISDLPASSAILLSGAGALRDQYAVRELPPADDMRWIELIPLDPTASEFVTARLGFAGRVPVVIEIVDSLNELTRVAFSDIEVNAGQSADDFDFVPPRGVTVVGPDD